MDCARYEGVGVEARWADLLWRLSTDEKATSRIELGRRA